MSTTSFGSMIMSFEAYLTSKMGVSMCFYYNFVIIIRIALYYKGTSYNYKDIRIRKTENPVFKGIDAKILNSELPD